MATYYVSLLGNDTTGDGSVLSPWRTLAHATGELAAGDVLKVQGALWHDRYPDNVITCTGTEANPINIQNDGSVMFDANAQTVTSWTDDDDDGVWDATLVLSGTDSVHIVWINGEQLLSYVDYIIIPALVPVKPQTAGVYDAAKMVRGMAWWESNVLHVKPWTAIDPNDVIVRACYGYAGIDNKAYSVLGSSYVRITGLDWQYTGGVIIGEPGASACDHVTVQHADWTYGSIFASVTYAPNTTFHGLAISHGGFVHSHEAIYSDGDTDDCIIEQCTFDDVAAAAVLGNAAVAGYTAHRCIFQRNKVTNLRLHYEVTNFQGEFPTPTVRGVGVFVWGGIYAVGHIIRNNIFSGPAYAHVMVGSVSPRIYHNTFYQPDAFVAGNYSPITFYYYASQACLAEIANNIFVVNGNYYIYQNANRADVAFLDNNVGYGGLAKPYYGYFDSTLATRNLAEMQAIGHELKGQAADPDMTDPANGDFTLTASSPCLLAANANYCPETDYAGRARVQNYADVGAYQYSVAATAELSFMRPAESSFSFDRTPPVVATEAVTTVIKGMFASNMFASWMFASRMFRASIVTPAILDQAITRPAETERIFTRP